MSETSTLRNPRVWFALVLLFLLTWIPRTLELDRFVTPDERKWLARSGNFYQAVAHGNFANTFQREHPGVTVMLAGTAGFLWKYPAYAADAPGQFDWKYEEIEPFLRQQGYDPLDLLEAGRQVVALTISIVLCLAFLVGVRLLGFWPAAFGFTLVAIDPFFVGLSRMLHVDGLVTSLVLLSLLAFCTYLYRGRPRRYLVISAMAAGFAWLTKSPALFLAPFVALLVGTELWRDRRNTEYGTRAAVQRALLPLVGWSILGWLTFVVVWPTMWVNPVDTLVQIFGTAEAYATEGHLNPTYFAGTVYEGDPGWLFYPVNYVWRATPITLSGLVLVLIAFAVGWHPLDTPERRRTAIALVLFGLLFTAFMSIGAKKFDRYLLPIYPPLDLVAALGWFAPIALLAERPSSWYVRRAAPAVAGIVIALQLFGTLRTYPYYLSYYNPLLGGEETAPDVMLIGWGEGLAEAARHLNDRPDAEELSVSAWYGDGPFSYYFEGEVRPIRFNSNITNVLRWLTTDYVVLYSNQWQRQLPASSLLNHFAEQEPEKVVTIDGLEYARVYNVQDAPPPDYLAVGQPRFTDWGDAIRLIAYTIPWEPLQPGDEFLTTFYLQNIGPMEKNYNVLVRIFDRAGNEVLRDEGWPWGAPTSEWERREVRPDGHEFTMPADAEPGFYRIQIEFYDPDTLEQLPAVDARTGESIGTALTVDYLTVAGLDREPAQPLDPPAQLGGVVTLLGVDVQTDEPIQVGDTLRARLYWQVDSRPQSDYTAFTHLVGPDGNLVAQRDQMPLGGFYPTSYWRAGQIIPDGTYEVALPEDAQPGTYTLYAGMYDRDTRERLQVTRAGEPAGDAVPVMQLEIE